MRRRTYLGALAAGIVAGTHGGVGAPSEGPSAPSRDDVSLPVPRSALVRSAPRDAIPAIVDPAFGPDWSDVSIELPGRGARTYRPRLAGEDEVIGVARGGAARAYPLKLLRWHEVVNDALPTRGRSPAAGAAGEEPLVVTYCPICRSGLVAVRRVRDRPTVFGVSGLLWRANLVLYDRLTDSLWSQLRAVAIRGPATGEALSPVPSTLTTWAGWRDAHPETRVLLPPPASGTVVGDVAFNYGIDLYERRRRIARRYPETGVLGDLDWSDTRLRRRSIVLGVVAGGRARAYPLRRVVARGPINDVVGGRPVVVAAVPGGNMVAYDRRVGGTTLAFSARSSRYLEGGGSRWLRLTGEAVDGPYEGRRLERATATTRVYWAAWLEAYPRTTVYGEEG